jgi:hypothetical protein
MVTIQKRMRRLGTTLFMLLLLLLIVPTAVLAQGSVEDVWTAEYFGNTELEAPVLYTETIPGPWLLRDWPYGEGPRRGGVPDDKFSARFTTTHTFAGGNVNFRLRSDDGSRMYLNGLLIIDAWTDRDGSWFESRVLPIRAGTYTIVVEYYDTGGANLVEAQFEATTDSPAAPDENLIIPGTSGVVSGTSAIPSSGNAQGGGTVSTSIEDTWTGEYFGNPDLEGDVLYTETIPGPWLLREWPYGEGPRRGGVPDDKFSARFTTTHTFQGGNINFRLRSDDGSRMYLNGFLIIDAWTDRDGSWFESRVLPIRAGTYTIVVEYYDTGGSNLVEAQFESTTDMPSANDEHFALPGTPGAGVVHPTTTTVGTGAPAVGQAVTSPLDGIIVDENSRYFTWSGSEPWAFSFYNGSYRNMYVWSDSEQYAKKVWGRWNPVFPASGAYDVFVHIPNQGGATINALYRVQSVAGLSDPIAVDQQASRNAWVYLGRFEFSAGYGVHFLYLNDLTYEADGTRVVVFDAASFVPVD